ncbi:glycosyltransferase family 41 protein [Aplosporella prunicola CBS 121167]|uniref:protein O-GlcNAc transferase n=1 Tax=Aplosporella prunicola CBS 121167 TaxID=1176127 RepID=A0A6A6AZV5_9PEZI|nr:glycosyltransferase family 41 protein [Aplosporella prunicola CBS 121167]KAF2137156.1 glycosyltransferase family 41 protein [Aplosporella prunicola CBS 121167]
MTMTRQYPPQPHSPAPHHLFRRNPSHGLYNPLPISPRTSATSDAFSGDRPLQQPPSQYALPLHRAGSYPRRDSPEKSHAAKVEQSEHMLRRKTPNGILAAAYDGTSVEQTEKPHAMKHILLPVTTAGGGVNPTAIPYGMKQELPLRTPGAMHGGSDTPLPLPQPPRGGEGYDSGHLGFDPSNMAWKRGQPPFPQIDSMLNQLPPHQQLQYMQMGQQLPVQPPFQTPLGPTVSNEQGPYGPYWPNGTFVPYRPAAIRDPRYHSAAASAWGQQQPVLANKINGHWPSHNNRAFGAGYAAPSPGTMGYNAGAVPFGATQTYGASSAQSWGPETTPWGPVHRNLHNTGLEQNGTGYHTGIVPGQYDPSFHGPPAPFVSGETTPRGDLTPIDASFQDFGPQSNNAQLREKVLDWAHQIYVDLLTYLHHARRHGQHTRHGQSHLPHMFPKPPRQPGADFSYANRDNHGLQSGTKKVGPTENGAERQLQRPSVGHARSSSLWNGSLSERHRLDHQRRSSWHQQPAPGPTQHAGQLSEGYRPLPRASGAGPAPMTFPPDSARIALQTISKWCRQSGWKWIDGMLVGGCLAYALQDFSGAYEWYYKILQLDKDHVEALSNLAAALHSLGRTTEAERNWIHAIRLRPSHFEAVEHLVGLLCQSQRGREAVSIIEYVEHSLQYRPAIPEAANGDRGSEASSSTGRSPLSEVSDWPVWEQDAEAENMPQELKDFLRHDVPGFGSSGYAIPGSENGRILSLVHAKGNMLYALGDNTRAAKAFEDAVMISVGRQVKDIGALIRRILRVVDEDEFGTAETGAHDEYSPTPILLPPAAALKTASLCFPNYGELPGLKYILNKGMSRKAAIATTSNSLLSLAKIFQDGMASGQPKTPSAASFGVRQILALYYLSLSLQPSPSTANNVGILLASVQQTRAPKMPYTDTELPKIPGVVPGSGIALALSYYNYGLNLDRNHAHLYTNLGSLLKDLGQLRSAISMYEQAVNCDPNFDIALANLANAVKDDSRIADAIIYYRRAVSANPDFAEAICGLANALNSVCSWTGRGGIAADGGRRDRWHVDDKGMLLDARMPGAVSTGWIKRVVDLVEKQLANGEDWGRGAMTGHFIESVVHLPITSRSYPNPREYKDALRKTLQRWSSQKWEGARVIRIVERATRRLVWQWYHDKYVERRQLQPSAYRRPPLPESLAVPQAPTVLPFHTFTCPMSAKQIRMISQRNGLRISTMTLKMPWLPRTVYPPPAPPAPCLKVGYVSSDFNNHPLAHLMQSVFGLHDGKKVKAYCYATTHSDGSIHRHQIEREAPVFHDAHSWSAERLVRQIVDDGIHILINLNGYTRGARNEVFAARPAPIQMSFMGFAGTLGAEWCDYLLADETAVPHTTLRDMRRNVDLGDLLIDEDAREDGERWVYNENIIYCRDTFFCCDHRQSAPDARGKENELTWEGEEERRWKMRKEIFPSLPDDTIILGNFNQLYKIEPTTFRTWLRVLSRIPNAILWLLRFPDAGEANLQATAHAWAGHDVAKRVIFTDVAPKGKHIERARVCDLFLDTAECNAHTTAADVLWSGTPLLTLPRYEYKMCSRMAASILKGALPDNEDGRRAATELIARDEEQYEEFAIRLARQYRYEGHRPTGRLAELRKLLFESRWDSALFDTKRWVRDLEEAYETAWQHWVKGEGGDIFLRGSRSKSMKAALR